jgi:hypothetical protein
MSVIAWPEQADSYLELKTWPRSCQLKFVVRGQTSWAKMMSLRGKLTEVACHPTNFVNNAEKKPFSPQTLHGTSTRGVVNVMGS